MRRHILLATVAALLLSGSPAADPTTLDTVVIHTTRLKELAAWYRKALGLPRPAGDGKRHLGFQLGKLYLGFDAEKQPRQTGAVTLWYAVDDLKGTYARVVAMGAKVVYAPRKMSWGAEMACVRDPDGNILGLSQRAASPMKLAPHRELVLEGRFPHLSPERMFACWTKPELLERWWTAKATVEPKAGGAYHFWWPRMKWHLRGTYRVFEQDKKLVFTWKWDHEPKDRKPKQVTVTIAALPEGGGSLLTITHGPYGPGKQQQAMRSKQHLPGWKHFCARLAKMK